MVFLLRLIFVITMVSVLNIALAEAFDSRVPMRESVKSSYYVDAQLDGVGTVSFMVDTGSSYTTINENTLALLKNGGNAQYSRELRGTLANGSSIVVPVYKLSGMSIGGQCRFSEIEAAVFPGRSRMILGLSALRQASPFIFSMDPPELVLSHCVGKEES